MPDIVTFLPADDLGNVRDALTDARNDVRRVLDESRPELDGLAAEGDALRAALRQHRPPTPTPAPAPVDVRRHISAPPVLDAPDDRLEAPVDFEFTSIGVDDSPELILTDRRHSVRMFVAMAATIGGIALMGTGWWLLRPPAGAAGSTRVESSKSSSGSKAPTGLKTPAANTAAPAVRAADKTAGERRATTPSAPSPIANPRSSLSIQLAARRSAWMRVTADGRLAAERIFKPGETLQVRATRDVSVRAGDAGAVTVSVDGRQPVAFGREGESLTRRFTVETPPASRPAPVAPPTPSPAVPIAQATPQRPPATSAASPSTTAAPSVPAPAPAPRVTEQPPVTPPPSVLTGGAPPASTPPRPAAAPADRPTAVAPPASAAVQTSLQDSLTSVASRWLDAYYRQDRATMASISAQVNIADDRGEKERMPRGLQVRRSLDDVNFRVIGTSEAMLTARMTERMDAAGQMAQAVSYVAHMWRQRNGAWQLHDVRIVSASALSRAVSR
jgi:hypothetical protein